MTLTDVIVGRIRNAWAKGGTVEEVSLLPAKVRWDSHASLDEHRPDADDLLEHPGQHPHVLSV